MASDKGYQDLGLDDVGSGTFSELTVEAQATEAFARFNTRVPAEVREKFMNAAMIAVRQAAARANDPRQVGVEELVHQFEVILRDLLDGKDPHG